MLSQMRGRATVDAVRGNKARVGAVPGVER
jgi:hypothetical protein